MALDIKAYKLIRAQAKAKGTVGQLVTVSFTPPPPNDGPAPGEKWLITGISVTVVNSAGVEAPGAFFYLYDQDPASFPPHADATVAGILDSNNDSEVLVEDGDKIVLVWTNVPVGDTCKARIQVQVVDIVDVARFFGR